MFKDRFMALDNDKSEVDSDDDGNGDSDNKKNYYNLEDAMETLVALC